jgi:hypothetical protein
MSQISVDSVIPQSGTTITVGASGDTVNLGSGVSTNGFLPSAISVSGTDFQFDSGYGSTVTAYGCRAWVNFNGKNTVAIRDSGNVSSITDDGVGEYTVNFTTAMPDENYSAAGMAQNGGANGTNISFPVSAFNINYFKLFCTGQSSDTKNDSDAILITIVR